VISLVPRKPRPKRDQERKWALEKENRVIQGKVRRVLPGLADSNFNQGMGAVGGGPGTSKLYIKPGDDPGILNPATPRKKKKKKAGGWSTGDACNSGKHERDGRIQRGDMQAPGGSLSKPRCEFWRAPVGGRWDRLPAISAEDDPPYANLGAISIQKTAPKFQLSDSAGFPHPG